MTAFDAKKSYEVADLRPKITVIGVGGAGGNAVNNMIRAKLQGVEFVVCNTDAQALSQSLTERRIQLGLNVTQGLGAGSKPEVGGAAAEESLDQIQQAIAGSNMVFVTAGMGGGTGTGAAPVVAKTARDKGMLTVAVVTKPFHFEGNHRMRTAEKGIEELAQFVDTLIIIPNQNLFRVANERTTFADAFKMADDVLHSGVRGVTDLMMMPGLINLDFADIRSIMSEMGKAMMGTGEAESEGRAIAAAEAAISNPLLDDVSMKGAQGVLINITGGLDMTLYEVDEAANRIREEVDPDANIIFGSTFDESMHGRMRVSVVATGIDAAGQKRRPLEVVNPQIQKSAAATQAASVAEEAARGGSALARALEESEAAELQPIAANTSAVEDEAHALMQSHDSEPELPLSSGSPRETYAASHGDEDPETQDRDYYLGEDEEDEDYHRHAEKPKRKGFFSRFAETVRGGLGSRHVDEDEEEEPQESRENMRLVSKARERTLADDREELDIPAFLRRRAGR